MGYGGWSINIIKIRQQTKGKRELPVKHPKHGGKPKSTSLWGAGASIYCIWKGKHLIHDVTWLSSTLSTAGNRRTPTFPQPTGHKQLHTNVIIEILAGDPGIRHKKPQRPRHWNGRLEQSAKSVYHTYAAYDKKWWKIYLQTSSPAT